MRKIRSRWLLVSFRYYDHYCSVVNVGGLKEDDLEAVRAENRKAKKLSDMKPPYIGVWWVCLDGNMKLITPSKQEALEKFASLKKHIIHLKRWKRYAAVHPLLWHYMEEFGDNFVRFCKEQNVPWTVHNEMHIIIREYKERGEIITMMDVYGLALKRRREVKEAIMSSR